MSRLIDADAFLKRNEVYADCEFNHPKYQDTLREIIEAEPSVDAVEVVHGEWAIDGMNEYELSYGCIGYEPIYRCSRCGRITESYLRTEKPIMPEDADFPKYCPNCGAKMDGEVKSDE